MINVHIPANLFYPELPGGSNQYFRYGPFLRDRDVQLHVHTVRKPHHEESEFEVHGIKVRRYEVPADFGLLAELEHVTDRALEAIGNDTRGTCLHPLGTMGASVSSVRRLWKARMRGISPCFHFMMVPVKEPGKFPGNLKGALRVRLILSPYRKVLMCSHVMGRAFEKVAGVSPGRIEVIPNGIDLSVFSPVSSDRKTELRRKLGLPGDAPIVLFVGSVIQRKGVDLLIQAWDQVISRHPQARLVITGSTGPRPTVREKVARSKAEKFLQKVSGQIDRLSDPGSIIFAGEVDNISEYYQASDLFAFASHHEGLPSVVLESMACGVPCVVAPFVGLPADGEEYGIAGEHYLRTTHEPRKIAADISNLIENGDIRKEMGMKACEWIRETQEMGKAADRLAEVYRGMIVPGLE